MDNLHVSNEQRIAAAAAADAIQHGQAPDLSGTLVHGDPAESVTLSEQDDLDLQKLGYKSVLARGWGSFDNFACSFSALYCIGGIRVLFYIALSNGGPAAMYVGIITCKASNADVCILQLEFLGFRKYCLDHHFSNTCRGMFHLSRSWIYLLLGLSILGWREIGTFRLFLGRCLDFGSLDRILGRGLLWCCELSGFRSCDFQSRHDLSSRYF
jgi:hypothetical protein